MIGNIRLDDPRACAAIKMGSLILAVSAIWLALAYIPYAASLLASVGLGAAVCMNMEKLPSERIPFAAYAVGAVSAIAGSAATYAATIGSFYANGNVRGIGASNTISLLVLAIAGLLVFSLVAAAHKVNSRLKEYNTASAGSKSRELRVATRMIAIILLAFSALVAIYFVLCNVPYGASLLSVTALTFCAYMNSDEIPSGRIPFAGCVLAGAFFLIMQAVLYAGISVKKIGPIGDLHLASTGEANLISFMLSLMGTICLGLIFGLLGYIYLIILHSCVAQAEKAKAATPEAA